MPRPPALNGIHQEQFKDPQIGRMQSSIAAAIQPLIAGQFTNQLTNGQLIRGVVTKASKFDVAHGLGRAFVGYLITAAYAEALIVLALSTTQTNPKTFVSLVATGAGTVDLWVF